MVRASFGVIPITVVCYNHYIGCPQVLRTDAGTKNSLLATIQPMLRHEHTDTFSQEKSHVYGNNIKPGEFGTTNHNYLVVLSCSEN